MMKENLQRNIVLVIVILAIVFVAFKTSRVKAPTPGELTDGTVVNPDGTNKDDGKNDTNTPIKKPVDIVSDEEAKLLADLKKAVDARDFESFANVLATVYKNQLGNKKEFTTLESALYVYATDTYWVKGDLENSLRVSNIVYNKVPEAWRFRYLRIVTLEKYGRNAFNAGDLKIAEDYANQILKMMYRPEGANLMADIYISKIKTNINNQDLNSAKNNLGYIWDYEVSADRRATLEDLKKQLGL